MKRKISIAVIIIFSCFTAAAQSPRTTINFNSGWKFFLGNDSNAINPSYNDAKWRSLNLPHDWSIESNFIKDAPATNQGGSLPGGIGWYRKTFSLPVSAKEKNVSIEFDGVYKNSEVWINGHYLGKRPYGYINFSYDLTPYLFFDQQNVIAVKVDNSQQPDSRWYTGSGIYRDVKLVMKSKTAFEENGIYVIPAFSEAGCSLNIHAMISAPPHSNALFDVKYELYDAGGKLVKDESYHTMMMHNLQGASTKHLFTYQFKNPVLWSVQMPYLYTLKATLMVDGVQADELRLKIGVRDFSFDAKKGFSLNNKPLKIHGVCMHHDLGALGAAFNKSAAKRQLQILKDMGCNAIRFSHNPPAAEMLNLCDEMGFLVIDEAFDMWQKKKNKFDYHLQFGEWHKQDLEAMIRRDRNHPSIIAWSIGNEIREQFDSTGTVIAKELAGIVKALDPARPVIAALTETLPEKNFISKSAALDILGFNYKSYDYAALPQRFPGAKFIATETASALETRGVYRQPSDSMHIWPPDYKAQDTFIGNSDFTAAAYDNTFAYWGGTHEQTWLAVKKYPHMAGIFVWCGFDFLGEPLPYPKFPARSSYYGIVDLAGFPKDVYYMYQSEWTTKNVLHLFPHWNWNKGDTVDVWAYYNNADEVELYLNGRSLGKQTKTDSTLHVMWRVPFAAGIIKAVSRKNGKAVATKTISSAGLPYKIELQVSSKKISASASELAFITARITDVKGNLVTGADRQINFTIKGNGSIAGTDNGFQADITGLQQPQRNSWKGLALAIIKPGSKKGNITVNASALGLQPASITLETTE